MCIRDRIATFETNSQQDQVRKSLFPLNELPFALNMAMDAVNTLIRVLIAQFDRLFKGEDTEIDEVRELGEAVEFVRDWMKVIQTQGTTYVITHSSRERLDEFDHRAYIGAFFPNNLNGFPALKQWARSWAYLGKTSEHLFNCFEAHAKSWPTLQPIYSQQGAYTD
eukprot:871152-Rhodomonas_salina.4